MLKVPIDFSLRERQVLEDYLKNNCYSYNCCDLGKIGRWVAYTMKSNELGTHWVNLKSLPKPEVGITLSGPMDLEEQKDLADKIILHYRTIVEEKMEGVGV